MTYFEKNYWFILCFIIWVSSYPMNFYGQINSFKFNNKFNHRLFTDAEGEIEGDTIRVSVACIGKWLVPSFQLETGSVVTVNGNEIHSKSSRLSFAQPVTFHVENPSVGFCHDYVIDVDFKTDHPSTKNRVPSIYIQTEDNELPTSKTVYKEATFRIDGSGVFPDLEEIPIKIRGRGNYSWIYNDKKPYKIKFYDKHKPFGLTSGKNWVLLSCNLLRSALCNAIAMEIAGEVESVAFNHIVPCDLYINGKYRGTYNFTENPGFGNNSIALADESRAVLLELDSHYDETYKFQDNFYSVSTNVKAPDFSENKNITFNELKDHYNSFCQVLHNGTDKELQQKLDVVSVAKARFVTELTRNTEFMHPKSWKLFNTDITHPDSLYIFGPVWDFDWSYGYEGTGNYFQTNAKDDLFVGLLPEKKGTPYFLQLFRGFDSIKREYYRLWVNWNQSQQIEELCDFIDCYYNYVSTSLKNNKTLWNDNTDYSTQKNTAKKWLRQRADYLMAHADIYDLEEYLIGDANNDGKVKIGDATTVLNHIVGVTSENFNAKAADANEDGKIMIGDVTTILNIIVSQ